MKKIFMALVCAAMMTSCGSAIDNFESFVEDTEKECAEFTAKDWENNNEKFEKIVAGLEKDKEEYTAEDMEKIGKLTARYMKLKMKQGMKSMEKMGSFMKGMVSGEE